MHNFPVALILVATCMTLVISRVRNRAGMDPEDDRFELPIYSTSISRATIRVILDFYAQVSSTLSITRSTMETNNLGQSGFVSEVLFHTKGNICITNEEYWSVSKVRLRFFNAMFIDGYSAFR